MKMNDEQFKNEVYRRRDAALKSRKTRRRIILSVLPAVAVIFISVVFIDKIGIHDKNLETEAIEGSDGAVLEETAKYTAYCDNVQLENEAASWLQENALPKDEGTPADFAGATQGNGIELEDNAEDTKSSSATIVLKTENREYRFILDEHGLYSCTEKRYIEEADIESFRRLIKEELK